MNGIPDCSECMHYDKNPMENPCYHCLDGYVGRPNFKRKVEKVEKKAPTQRGRKPKSEDEPLPWT